MPSIHAEIPFKPSDFEIGSGLSPNATLSGRTETRPNSSNLRKALRVEPRSHRKPSCQGRDLRGSRRFPLFPWPRPASRPSTRSRSRPGPEAAISLVKPACSLTFNPFGTINSAHGHIPVGQSPPKTTGKSTPFPASLLDSSSGSASTTGSRGPSWPCSIEERKASQSLPAPTPVLEPE